jgi:hypothetical protein
MPAEYAATVSFFEPPPPLPEMFARRSDPEWLGPRQNVMPMPFELWAVLARTDSVAIALHDGLAYTDGFTFGLSLRRRQGRRGPEGDPINLWHHTRGEIPPEALRFGLQFADGAKATVFDQHRWFVTADAPAGPTLVQHGGMGRERSWEMPFWSWPLPPPGPVAFVCEWPAEQIELTRYEIDAAVIREAAAKAEALWPEPEEADSSGSVSAARDA